MVVYANAGCHRSRPCQRIISRRGPGDRMQNRLSPLFRVVYHALKVDKDNRLPRRPGSSPRRASKPHPPSHPFLCRRPSLYGLYPTHGTESGVRAMSVPGYGFYRLGPFPPRLECARPTILPPDLDQIKLSLLKGPYLIRRVERPHFNAFHPCLPL